MPASQTAFIVGAGAVGLAMARALSLGGYNVTGIWNRGEAGRQRAESIGVPVHADVEIRAAGTACLVLVCVNDDAISEVGAALARGGHLAEGSVVAHTSGCLAADALGALSSPSRGSLHPLVAVSREPEAYQALMGASYAIEGEPEALTALESLVARLHGEVLHIRSDAKPRYHAAAAMASNLIVALLHEAAMQAQSCSNQDPLPWLSKLATGAIENAARVGTLAALTGPVARGDVGTVSRHLQAIDSEVLALYRQASLRALEMARQRGLDSSQVKALARLLGSPSGAIGS